jgi:hypothetical protein
VLRAQVVQSLERELAAVVADLKRLHAMRQQLEVRAFRSSRFLHFDSVVRSLCCRVLTSPRARQRDIHDKRAALQLDAECLRLRYGLGEQPIA